MKHSRIIIMTVLAVLLAFLPGCVPGEGGTGNEEQDKYKVWTSGRAEGVRADEPSKQTEEYTLMEPTAEDFTVARYYGDNMIVPRDRKIVIWGTAPESQNGKVVAAEFKGLKGSGVIENGEFSFALQGTLPASKEKGNYLVVRGAEKEVKFKDVLVGDIWIVSGQSNADLTFFGTVAQSTKDISALYSDYLDNATADDDIRLIQQINWNILNKTGVERMSSPQSDIGRNTKWQIAERRKVYGSGATNSFSMLGYFFAKELYKINPDVPIGMVMGACGGASISILASSDAIEKFPQSLKNGTLTIENTTIPVSGIYNAFMAPLRNVGVTGMIFYQGESDAMLSEDYCLALKATVEDYREKFGSDMLFLNVQLTSYGYYSGGAELTGVWDAVPDMRFAQASVKIDKSISNYEVIPTIDVGWQRGDADGAHPYYKLEMGQRGAAMAAALVYGIGEMENAGFPVPSKICYNDEEIVIEYDYAGGGLKTSNGTDVKGFEVKLSGEWTPAEATVDGNKIIIAAGKPEGVRYASNIHYTDLSDANLCSGTGNIAVPFSAEFK